MPGRLRTLFAEYVALDRRIWSLAAVRAVNTFGLSLASSFMGSYLVNSFGIRAATWGVIGFIVNLGQSAASSWAGGYSDVHGRRQVAVRGQFLRAIVIAGLGTLMIVRAPVVVIALVMLVNGIVRGCIEPVVSAWVADIAPPDKRVAAFGLQRMGVNLGWAVGPAFGGLLADRIGYGEVFFCALPFLLAADLVLARTTEPVRRAAAPPPRRLREGIAALRRRPDFTLLLAGAFMFSLAYTQQFTVLQVYATRHLDLTMGDMGLIYGATGIAVVLFQIPAIALIARFHTQRALIVGGLLLVAAFLLIGAAGSFAALLGAVMVQTAAELLLTPAQTASVAELGDPERLGSAFGLFGTMQMLGVAIAPLCGGLAFDHLGHRPMAMWGTLTAMPVALVGLFIAFALVRRRTVASLAGGVVVAVNQPEVSGPLQR